MQLYSYTNPYTGLTFFEFFIQLALRLLSFLRGDLPIQELVSDEIQIIVIMGVAVSSALVGTFLVLKKMTMLANSLSHTILIGIVIAFLLTEQGFTHGNFAPLDVQAMLLASLVMGVVTSFLTELLTKGAHLQEDASTGIVFTSLFAVGIIAVTLLTRNAHIGTEVVMGNADALQIEDCQLTYLVLVVNILLFCLFFKEFKITTFDSGLARALGISPIIFNYLLMLQVSATIVVAFRAVGVLMVLSFITGPALTARLLTNTLGKMLIIAVGVGCLASIFGVSLSRHMLSAYGISFSTAGIIVCMLLVFYLLAAIKNHWFKCCVT